MPLQHGFCTSTNLVWYSVDIYIYGVAFIFPTGNPWTLQYVLQQLVSKSRFWPTVYNGCRCDRETLFWIEQGGFELVQSVKTWPSWSPEKYSEKHSFDWGTRLILYIINSMLVGFAEKGKTAEEKKHL